MNKILVLIILIFLINHLTDGKIIDTIKRYFITCKGNVENFIGLTYKQNSIKPNVPVIPYQLQKDFPYLNHNDPQNLDDESYDLYKFINSMVTVNVNNYELTKSRDTRLKASEALEKEIYDHIDRIFNCSGYKFNNIRFLSNVYYYKNPRGKDIEPFEFSADVTVNSKFIGSVILNLECFLREDKFYYRSKDTALLTILKVNLLNRTYPDGKNKEKIWRSAYKVLPKDKYQPIEPDNERIINAVEKEAMKYTIDLKNKMVESFENHFVNRENYDDLFIKPSSPAKHVSFQNDTENSLIPSIIEFSACN